MMRSPDGTVHFSELKTLALSPAHYRYAILAARAEAEGMRQRDVTPAMRLGMLVDMLLLTDREPIVAGDTRVSARYKAARARVPPEVEVFTETELERSMAVVKAARAHAVARDYLGLDDPERRTQVPLRWETRGIERSTRGVDVLTKGRLVDLKVTASTQPDRFARHARRMAWHCQIADYLDAARQNGIDVSGGGFLLGIEAAPPHPVTALRIGEEVRLEAEKTLAGWLETLRASELADAWPGYAEEAVEFEMVGLDEIDDLIWPDEATTGAGG
jgi:hypothetical protein